MFLKKIFCLIGALSFMYGVSGDTTTVVLQNGTDNYQGCEDSYNYNWDSTGNYSDNPELHTWNCLA